MPKSAEDYFNAATANAGRELSQEELGCLEKALSMLAVDERPPWYSSANFALGMHYSDKYFGDCTSTSKSWVISKVANDYRLLKETNDKVIEYFTAFLASSPRPCFKLPAKVSHPPLDGKLWATYCIDHHDSNTYDSRISYQNDEEQFEDRSKHYAEKTELNVIALDRLALAHYLNNEPGKAADALVSYREFTNVDMGDVSPLWAWIGWLSFDGGNFQQAAEYLQACWDSLEDECDIEDEGERELANLLSFYRQYGSVDMYGSPLHAYTDMGNGSDFLPSGTLAQGCDAFLLRLAISHAACGDYEKATRAAKVCREVSKVHIGEDHSHLPTHDPIPFPVAWVFLAALSLKIGQLEQAAKAIDWLFRRNSNEYFAESYCLAAHFFYWCPESWLEDPGMPRDFLAEPCIKALAKYVWSLDADNRKWLEHECSQITDSLLDGSLVSQNLTSINAGIVADWMLTCMNSGDHLNPANTKSQPEAIDVSTVPYEVLGHAVLSRCPICRGEGVLWQVDEATGQWAERCRACNSVGYILGLPRGWEQQPDEPPLEDSEIPF